MGILAGSPKATGLCYSLEGRALLQKTREELASL